MNGLTAEHLLFVYFFLLYDDVELVINIQNEEMYTNHDPLTHVSIVLV